MAEGILALQIAFALGSFPTAFVAGKLLSRGDIREAGSGNPGTLNAVRQYGKLVGLVVLLIDAGKGILAVIIAQAMSVTDPWIYLTALLVTLGHNFTPVLKFRGGKGAATVLGISAFMLWQITAISGAAGLLVLLLTRRGVLAVTCVFIVLNALTIVTGQATGQIVLCLVLSFLVAGTHLWRQSDEVTDAVRERSWRRFLSIE